ncbi:HD domain-containing protein [Candidatus Mycoplasma haematohominis]|uniref:Deoxyguanosinetriphosphate triphosphohydrolase-like protein n=1 Tax=Candidatus Mycoplasma haematohominis TaxID=1494318 RepID=A0A478FTJ6_9MOLU|nr:HD domain-containing protein [Candidatus Mycoplasma haemohominis]GCE63759.1 deoxyguanosinetriphosphate triphosphohydrolase-like protein [Candidatus Mycoplasma haemohominis]
MNKLLGFHIPHLAIKKDQSHFIKDPIYRSIHFDREQTWLYQLVDTLEFQRLHRLKQMSLNFYNFSSALHTRFTHSLGVYELCNRFIKHFISEGELDKEKNFKEINIALGAAILHDIGHGPLSHAFEYAIKNFEHERMGIRIITSPETKINKLLREKSLHDGLDEDFYAREIVKVLDKSSEYKWITELISSDVDVDRMDYLVRDSYFSGVRYGNNIDVDLFIKWSTIQNGSFGFRKKIMNSLEHFALSRKHMYEDLYNNAVFRVYENLITKICNFLVTHIDHYKSKPSFQKYLFMFLMPDENWPLEDFLDLDDERFLIFLQSALIDGIMFDEARIYLGLLFGIWLDEKGNPISARDIEVEKVPLDEATLVKQEKKKGDKFIKVNIWDPYNKRLTPILI